MGRNAVNEVALGGEGGGGEGGTYRNWAFSGRIWERRRTSASRRGGRGIGRTSDAVEVDSESNDGDARLEVFNPESDCEFD